MLEEVHPMKARLSEMKSHSNEKRDQLKNKNIEVQESGLRLAQAKSRSHLNPTLSTKLKCFVYDFS